ncbi:MAG TPA: EamA family transporter [Halomicronema sp.]
MSLQELVLFFISVIVSAAGQFLLKAGALKLAGLSTDNPWGIMWLILSTKEIIAGLTCYALGVVFYILLLSRVNLSIAGPALAIVYVFSVLLGYFVFKEPIPLRRIIGLGFIVAGVILVVWQKK